MYNRKFIFVCCVPRSCPKGIFPVEITDQVTCEILEAKQKLMHKIKTDM